MPTGEELDEHLAQGRSNAKKYFPPQSYIVPSKTEYFDYDEYYKLENKKDNAKG